MKDQIELIGGPHHGTKVPNNRGTFVRYMEEGNMAVYKEIYAKGKLYYIWVGWSNPNFVNCFIENEGG